MRRDLPIHWCCKFPVINLFFLSNSIFCMILFNASHQPKFHLASVDDPVPLVNAISIVTVEVGTAVISPPLLSLSLSFVVKAILLWWVNIIRIETHGKCAVRSFVCDHKIIIFSIFISIRKGVDFFLKLTRNLSQLMNLLSLLLQFEVFLIISSIIQVTSLSSPNVN